MFCRKCGEQLEENAKFCAKCGSSTTVDEQGTTEVNKEERKIDNNVIKYTLKPTFNYGYKICSIIGTTLLFVLLIGLYFLEEIELAWAYSTLTGELKIVPVIIIAAIIIYVYIKLIFDKKQYEKLEYNFYHNKLEYIDGFINKEQKELKYKNIREVTMSQNILERIFRIGTIKIFTNASSGVYGGSSHRNMNAKNGIIVHCVTDVKEKYQQVKQIIDEGTEE